MFYYHLKPLNDNKIGGKMGKKPLFSLVLVDKKKWN